MEKRKRQKVRNNDCTGSAVVKNPPANTGNMGSIPVLGRSPGEWHDNPLQYSSLENPHGQRSLEGYGPWGHKESDTTEQLSTFSPTHVSKT